MKLINKFAALVLGVLMFVTITGCGSKNYDEYIGYQFAGKDPWGTELAITVREIKDNKITYTMTDLAGDLTLYQELSGELKDDAVAFNFKGTATEDEKMTFDYSGTITLKDGKINVKYENGQLTSNSTEGGSSSYNVGALEDNLKTVTLEKTVDNS